MSLLILAEYKQNDYSILKFEFESRLNKDYKQRKGNYYETNY